MSKTGKSTQAIHGRRDKSYNSVNYPIYNSSAFAVNDSDDYEGMFDQDAGDRYSYTRYGNPSIRNVEEKLAKLEHGEDAVLFSSGMAAISATLLSLVDKDDGLAVSSRLYGVTHDFVRNFLPRFGIDVHFLDEDELYDLPRYAPNVKAVYFETPNNPNCACVSIPQVVAAAREIGAVTIVDNTFASPVNQNPIDFGVDVVLHSVTKYIGGHSDLMAGAVISRKALIQPIHHMMSLLGGCINPQDAALIDRSLKTLVVRVQQQNENALKLAQFFSAEKKVKRVHYPGLPESPYHEVAKAQMSGFGGMFAIDLEDLNAAKAFCDSLQVAFNATSLGGVDTLVSIPVLTSQRHFNDEELRAIDVTQGTVRISAGLEDVDDLIQDFAQALTKA